MYLGSRKTKFSSFKSQNRDKQNIMWTCYFFSKGDKRHYCLIRKLTRLLGDRTNHDGQNYYCNFCLHGFCRQELLNEHIPYCSPHGPQKLTFPKSEDDQWVLFKQVRKQLKVPFVIYLDLESLTIHVPIHLCDSNPAHFSTTPYQKHEPCGFCYYVKCSDDIRSKPAYVYRGPNAMDHLFECLIREEEENTKILSQIHPHVPILTGRTWIQKRDELSHLWATNGGWQG